MKSKRKTKRLLTVLATIAATWFFTFMTDFVSVTNQNEPIFAIKVRDNDEGKQWVGLFYFVKRPQGVAFCIEDQESSVSICHAVEQELEIHSWFYRSEY